ncbi:nitrilase-related carbon-nitrogen hydrolase [Phreatobacter stygius]|uniref:Hydrolase n=1 Tax=Phreatobacter stygius TaxID=1940610 RepID=A0A4D7BEB6_9HYPH|nr:nitrilase-related carbon-nitrogen hydrolase [Phreatobacter stygius]QCI66322.1 hydrolase [Phreatobacter stygius]
MSDTPERLPDAAVTVAVAQFAGTADVSANLAGIERLAGAAAARGAAIAVFPEASMYDFTAPAARIAEIARSDGGRFEAEVHAIARRHGIAIVAGTYGDSGGPLARNSLIVADAKGESLGRYEKLHLYDAFHYRESDKNAHAPLQQGFGELTTFDLAGFRFGLLNCYDIRFPEMARLLIDRGANVLLVASGWVAGPLKELHWETLLKARAIENTCYVAASCQPAPLSVGLSMIVDPSGLAAATAVGGEGLAIATLTAGRLNAVRELLPSLRHRRYAVVQKQ